LKICIVCEEEFEGKTKYCSSECQDIELNKRRRERGYDKLYYQKNKDKRSEYFRKYYQENKEKKKEYSKKQYQQRKERKNSE
jgi:hypothetical protein